MSVKSANVDGIIRGPITVRQCPTPKPSSLIPTTVPATPINYQIKRAQGFWTNWNSEKVGVFHDRGDLHRFGTPGNSCRSFRPILHPFPLPFPISRFVESIKRSTFSPLSLFHNLRHGKKKRRINHAEKLFEPRKLCEILIGVITRIPVRGIQGSRNGTTRKRRKTARIHVSACKRHALLANESFNRRSLTRVSF